MATSKELQLNVSSTNQWCPSRAHIEANTVYYLQQRDTDCGIWILPLQSALVISHLKCWELNNDVGLLEWVQSASPTKKGCESWDCSAWEKSRFQREELSLTAAFQYLKKAYEEEMETFTGICSDSNMCSGFKFKEGRFRLD